MAEFHDNDSAKARQKDTLRGSALARLLDERALELGKSQKEVASILEISYPYYALLMNGERWFGSVNKTKLINIGKFLGIPTASVYMLAEVLDINDWFGRNSLADTVEMVFKSMQKDKRYTICLPTPAKWAEASLEMKLSIVLLYQELSKKTLLGNLCTKQFRT